MPSQRQRAMLSIDQDVQLELDRISRSRTESAQRVERAKMLVDYASGDAVSFHYPTLESEDVLFLLLTRLICTCSNFRERTALQTLVISDSGCRLLG